jgi:hypothetical protein
MGKKASCAFAGAWIMLVVLVAILVIFFLLSSLFDLGVWDELVDWVLSTVISPNGG